MNINEIKDLKLNIYSCDSCHQLIITIDIDEGTTPAFLNCRTTKDCLGTMHSHGYTVKKFVWFTPDPDIKDYLGKFLYDEGMREHIKMGGLDIKEL